MMINRVSSFILCLFVLLCGCTKSGANNSNLDNTDDVSSIPLEKRVGMLFMIRAESLDRSIPLDQVNARYEYGVTKVSSEMKKCYRSYPAGGICVFLKNIDNPTQLHKFVNDFRSLNPNILFSIDEEGGRISRIAENPKFDVPHFEPMLTLTEGKTPDEAAAIGQNVGQKIGKYLKEYGFDIDFAPVADVNTNPNNIVIGNRAFGSDPTIAACAVSGVLAGLAENGIVGCLKHFPGHGDTTGDTHEGYVRTDKTCEQLANCEMIPFRAGIQAGAKMVMTAHIAVPNVTGEEQLPSTLSGTILQDKLRGELGFDGVIVSDAMSMGAIHNEYSSGEAAVKAFLAGCDILLMPFDYIEAYQTVLEAVKNGTISESRLNESVKRIMKLKK
ncbi:MAG: glycoside hydrolase family 3 protein [Spirochaetales bacterium]|nr:glycoside hydrolase family 3 protein [Spirochaetales bacterium]